MTKIYETAKKYAHEKAGIDVSLKEAYEDGMVDMLEWVCEYLEIEHPTWYEHFGDELKKAMEE